LSPFATHDANGREFLPGIGFHREIIRLPIFAIPKFRSQRPAFLTEILALLSEARCKQMEKTMIVKWKIKESETIPILHLLPELVGESRKEEDHISLKTIPVN